MVHGKIVDLKLELNFLVNSLWWHMLSQMTYNATVIYFVQLKNNPVPILIVSSTDFMRKKKLLTLSTPQID